MIKAATVALLGFASLSAVAADDAVDQFTAFLERYNKNYGAEEYSERFEVFQNNLRIIDQLNQANVAAGLDEAFGVNEFADIEPEVFDSIYKGYHHVEADTSNAQLFDVDAWLTEMGPDAVPTSYDWRTKGAVTAVKNQGQCGSCWAFSTTEGVESAWFLANQNLPVLAPQQIVDCDQQDDGCNGGDLPTAFSYVEGAGLESEQDYPYQAVDQQCQYQKSDVIATMKTWGYATQSGDETAMQAASMQHGPLSICVDASTWQFYSGGIIRSGCGDSLDHCVQIVGWNTGTSSSKPAVPYWIVRNSWGTDWGLSGYLWVERNEDECGIADEATYVIGGTN